MKPKFNLVSMLMGAALGAVAILTIAATTAQTLPYGRFQLLATDNYLFKIDTSTGQVWKTSVNAPARDFLAPNLTESKTDQ